MMRCADRPSPQFYFLGASQASVTALSIMCRCNLRHCVQVKVRRSWPNALGSIAVNFIGEPHAVHCGPWFCVSSMRLSCSGRAQHSQGVRIAGEVPSRRRRRDGVIIMLRRVPERLLNTAQIRKIDDAGRRDEQPMLHDGRELRRSRP
jgi:hypothetical protein